MKLKLIAAVAVVLAAVTSGGMYLASKTEPVSSVQTAKPTEPSPSPTTSLPPPPAAASLPSLSDAPAPSPVVPAVKDTPVQHYRIGATCVDGSHSEATGRGACSWHGGVSEWLYN